MSDFAILGNLRKNKKAAKRAAKRMVHGDQDPWRKTCESYGFMLAKSMIMMKSEMHRERMKPKNIYKDLGRDHWDYANDRVIGTGNGWNYSVIDSQLNPPRVQSVGRTPENVDDSLMRATVQTQMVSPLTEQNVAGYEQVEGHIEVLNKEFTLGKDLLEKAIRNIDDDCLNNLKNHQDASQHDVNSANVFFKVLNMLNNTDEQDYENWEQISDNFNEGLKEDLQNAPDQIERGNFDKSKVDSLREQFRMKSDAPEEAQSIRNLKEFLCEAFCLIEIVQELNELKAAAGDNMVSFNTFYLF